METTTFNVGGMMCDACVGHVTSALLGLDGVQRADVSLENKSATVIYDPAKVQVAQMAEAVADEGYEASV